MGQYLSDTITPGSTPAHRDLPDVKGTLWIWETSGNAGSVIADTREGRIVVPIPAFGFRIIDFEMDVHSLSFTGSSSSFTVDFGSGYKIGPPLAFNGSSDGLLTKAT